MLPDRGSNLQPFSAQTMDQPAEPPGQGWVCECQHCYETRQFLFAQLGEKWVLNVVKGFLASLEVIDYMRFLCRSINMMYDMNGFPN